MNRAEEIADGLTSLPERAWWAGPVAMVAVSALAVTAALVVQPGTDEWSYVFGHRLGGPCGFEVATGLSCPSCGMTRSWLWLVRGQPVRAFLYNPAGATLLAGLVVMGVVGLIRLVMRDPRRLRIPVHVLSTIVLVWMIGPYMTGWIARLFGLNPLP